jgi:hypothetical protein
LQPSTRTDRPLLRWRKIPLCLAAAAVGVGLGLLAAPAPVASIQGLAAELGAEVGGVVTPADIRWEPSRGPILDLVLGRRILFLASETAKGPRDVYRAGARVTPEGRVLELLAAKNLTATPLGDDHALVLEGQHAAFATFVYGQEQTVTWLDLAGERDRDVPPDESFADRVTEYLTRLDETGSGRGIGRVEVSLVPPAQAVGLALAPSSSSLTIELIDGEGNRGVAVLDGDRGELTQAPLSGMSGIHADAVRRLPKRFVLWAVDTVRAQVGPAPVAWLEEHVFAVRDSMRRAAYTSGAPENTQTLAEIAPAAQLPEPAAAALDASKAGGDGVTWPPPTVPSIWKTKEPGEGEWQEPRFAWSARRDAPDSPPPAFYKTFVRPDPDRPYSRVILVAMDMRQLDLAMEAGTEDPKPLTGGHGPGRIPREPGVAPRVVAAWNGGFKTEHGTYGMMVNRRILLPPQPNAATVVVLKDQRVGFGTWGDAHDVTGIRGVPDDDVLSFRQNLDPLVDRGEVNPMGRALWGYTLPGTTMQTERTGMCVTDSGQLLYAWGDDLNATALGKALKAAGCTYAMHLDMNPHHTGFIFAKINELRGHNYRTELLTPLMTVSPDRYIEYAPKDFFYALVHSPVPPPVDAATFHQDPGAQPPPAWAPAIWSTTLDAGDAHVELALVEGSRARFRIRGGVKEPDAKTGASPVRELDGEDAHQVVLAVGLGHALDKRPRGLATDGRLSFPMHQLEAGDTDANGFAALLADADGALSIVRPRDVTAIGPHVDLAELPLLVDDGAVVPEVRRAGPGTPTSRGALGMRPDGSVLIARATATSDAPLAEVLVKAGCRRAVALDRGAHVPPFYQRVGTSTPPRGRSDETALYVLSAPMKPRAFRFEAAAAAAVAQVTKPR